MDTVNDSIENIVEDLRWGHPETRKSAAIKLGRIRNNDVIPFLIEAMEKDDYMWTRISAIQSLAWIANLTAVPAIITAARADKEKMVRKTAITTLGALRDKRALSTLELIVTNNSEDDELRNAASLAIEIINGITPDYSQAT